MKILITILLILISFKSYSQVKDTVILKLSSGGGGTTYTFLPPLYSSGTNAYADTFYTSSGLATRLRLSLDSLALINIINGKIALTSLSATSPLSYNNTTGVFSINQSNTSTNGYLSSTDWNTFNNKQGTITLTTTGTSGAATLISNTLNIPQYAGTTYSAGYGIILTGSTFKTDTTVIVPRGATSDSTQYLQLNGRPIKFTAIDNASFLSTTEMTNYTGTAYKCYIAGSPNPNQTYYFDSTVTLTVDGVNVFSSSKTTGTGISLWVKSANANLISKLTNDIGYSVVPFTNTALQYVTGYNTIGSFNDSAKAAVTGLYLPIANPSYTGILNTGTLGFTDPTSLVTLQSSTNNYNQVIIRNTNSGSTASADFVASNNNGTATTYYANMGINSSGFTGTGAFNQPNASYFTGTSGDAAFGTTTANAVHILANNSATDAITISSANAISFPQLTTNGVLVTTGSNGAVSATTTPTFTGTNITGIPNAALTNSSITIAGNATALGGSVTQDNITGLSSTGLIKRTAANTLGIAVSGTDYQAPYTNLTSIGSLANASGVLFNNGSGTFSYSTTPTLTGTNITGIPNTGLTNSSLTVNGTSISLGGSGTVTAAAGTLTGTTLNSTVVSSSLTSVGTIATGVWNGTAIASNYNTNFIIQTAQTAGTDFTVVGAGVTQVNPASVITTLNITLPASPTAGDIVTLEFGGTITSGNPVVNTLNILANTGQTVTFFLTPTAASGDDNMQFQALSTTLWKRIK